MMALRRTLRFRSLDEVVTDVKRLSQGHRTVGKWSLAEICQHLAASIRLSADMPATTTHDPSLRFSQDKIDDIFRTGNMPEGMPRPATASPFQPLDEQAAINLLRDAIAYYLASSGPVASHRYFGPLNKAQWDQLQLIHCAHHLSFAIPTELPST